MEYSETLAQKEKNMATERFLKLGIPSSIISRLSSVTQNTEPAAQVPTLCPPLLSASPRIVIPGLTVQLWLV